MNITFMIGNGFDLGIGLHTQYEDFYKVYCNETKGDNENISNFKKMLLNRNDDEQKKIIDWADFEKAFGEYSTAFKIEDKRQYLECFEDFVMKFNAYLENEAMSVDYSNEDLIGQSMNNAVRTYYHIREEDKTAITARYSQNNGAVYYHFISFNYTNSIDECAEILKKVIARENNRDVGDVLHVHGYVENNMIMGVNDASQIKNPELAADSDVLNELVKPLQNNEGRTAYDRKVTARINNSDIICIYGMSLGETDKKWWMQVASWLAGNDKRMLVILQHDKAYNQRFVFSQQMIVNKTLQRFLSFSDLEDNKKEAIRKRIYVGGNHDVFAMRLRREPAKTQSQASTFDELISAAKEAKKEVAQLTGGVLPISVEVPEAMVPSEILKQIAR